MTDKLRFKFKSRYHRDDDGNVIFTNILVRMPGEVFDEILNFMPFEAIEGVENLYVVESPKFHDEQKEVFVCEIEGEFVFIMIIAGKVGKHEEEEIVLLFIEDVLNRFAEYADKSVSGSVKDEVYIN